LAINNLVAPRLQRQDSSGRRRYASKTFHGTKKQADVALAAFVTEVAKDWNASVAAEPTSYGAAPER
jgi:hypothetical protein